MNLHELLTSRHSVRDFLPKPIDPDLLKSIFNNAQQSASNCNVQPWHTYVASGEKRQELEKLLMHNLMTDPNPAPEFDWTPRYQDKHRDRQFGSANALYSAMGIERSDKQARQMAMAKNWQFFGAPHVAFFCMEKYLGIMGAVDLGIYAQTLSLLFEEAGISSCMQGALGQFPKPIKKVLEIPDSVGILFGMSFGYAKPDALANNATTDRARLQESVLFFD
ncbi:MAG: nitroreductase [Kangiellaceae bacterium]|nr:nitroreductase [Kangiellaceae bacterium]